MQPEQAYPDVRNELNPLYSGKPLSIHVLNWKICVFVRGGKGGGGIEFDEICR
jgi:hypothetical protein